MSFNLRYCTNGAVHASIRLCVRYITSCINELTAMIKWFYRTVKAATVKRRLSTWAFGFGLWSFCALQTSAAAGCSEFAWRKMRKRYQVLEQETKRKHSKQHNYTPARLYKLWIVTTQLNYSADLLNMYWLVVDVYSWLSGQKLLD